MPSATTDWTAFGFRPSVCRIVGAICPVSTFAVMVFGLLSPGVVPELPGAARARILGDIQPDGTGRG